MKRIISFLMIVSVMILVHILDLWAVPADSRPGKFTQPDGTTFIGRVFGDEFQMWIETIEGYTIVKNYKDGFWYYAEFGTNGKLTPSTLRVGEGDPVNFGFSKHLREPEPVWEKPHKGREVTSAGEKTSTAMLGDVTLGVILIEFPDKKGGRSNIRGEDFRYTKNHFWNMIYGENYKTPNPNEPTSTPRSPDLEAIYGSVKEYFYEISYGAVNITGVYGNTEDILNPDVDEDGIPEWYECSVNKNEECWIDIDIPEQCDSVACSTGCGKPITLYNEAVAQAESHNYNPGSYDKICVIFAGKPLHYTFLWPQADTISDKWYITSEWFGMHGEDDMTFSHVGIHCHELGHIVLGLDDMYKNNNIVGTWGLMGFGCYNGPDQGGEWPHMKGACPAHPTILNKIKAGFEITPQIATTGDNIVIPEIEVDDVNSVVVYQIPVSDDEYFIVENRQCQDFDAYLPPHIAPAGKQGGLLIWHKKGDRQFLEQADGKWEIVTNPMNNPEEGDYSTSRSGDYTDPYPCDYTVFNDRFTPVSNPNSNGLNPGEIEHISENQNILTCISIKNITRSGDSVIVDFILESSMMGDVNCDSVINIKDVIHAVNIILETLSPAYDYSSAVDCNEDEAINILDVICIVNIILGISPGDSPIEKGIVTLASVNENECNLWLSNPDSTAGVEVHIPFYSTFNSLTKDFRSEDLDSAFNIKSDTLIALLYGPNGETIVPGNGPIFNFTFSPDANPHIANVVLSTPDGAEIDVEINHQPNTPGNPSPADGATDQSVDVDLSWSGGDPDTGNTVTYDVYLGTSSPPPLADSVLTTSSYDPGPLDNGCTYYWQIAAKDNHEVPTYGPEWTFSTPPNTVDLYPSKDTYIIAHPAYQTYNTGAKNYVSTGRNSKYPDYVHRTLMEFDLSGIPSGAVIDEASIHVFVLANSRCKHTTELNVFRMEHEWLEGTGEFEQSEDGATWLTSDGWTDWLGGPGAAGTGDCEQTAIGSVTIPYLAGIGQEIIIPLDGAAIEEMLEGGSFGNFGFLIKDTDEYQDAYVYHSSESSDSPSWPRLEIIYRGCDGTSPGDTSQPGNNPPSITITSPPASGDTADNTYTIIWTSEDPDTDVCTVDLYYDTNTSPGGETQIVLNTADDGSYSWTTTDVIEDSYYIYGVIDDGNGGTDSDYSAGRVTIVHDTSSCEPQISELNPSSGDVGSTVWIYGNHFGENQGSSEVTFYQEKMASISFWSDTQIKCAVPQGAEDGYVTVTTGCGTSDGVNFDVTEGGDPGCPYVSPWTGNGYAVGNNILAASEDTHRTELNVIDYFRMERPCVEKDDRYWLQISEFEQEHTWLDEITLKTVDHPQGLNLGVTDEGELFLYTREVQPVSCVDSGEVDQLELINTIGDGDYEGFPDDWLTVDFGHIGNPQNMYVEVVADLYPPKDQTIVLQLRGDHEWDWHDIALLHPRQHWATHLVDLSPHIDSNPQDIAIRLYWLAQHKVDYICLAQSIPGPIVEKECVLESAVHSVAGVVTDSLSTADEKYAELIPGENIEVSFIPTEPTEGFKRDFVFVATGHYITEEGGAPVKPAMGIPSRLPTEFSLAQNYPNPFNPETEITFALPEASKVRLTIYNILGQIVEVLIDSEMRAGYHTVTWNGKSVASGIYFYRIAAGEFTNTKRMLLLK